MKRHLFWSALLSSGLVQAGTPAQVLDGLVREAGAPAVGVRGEQLYRARQTAGEAESCMACHGPDPRLPGRHVRTHKEIAALAPSANDARFTDPAKVEKWFKRNCKEVLGRFCSAQEKADFAAYLISVR